jgi:hypothetical protein
VAPSSGACAEGSYSDQNIVFRFRIAHAQRALAFKGCCSKAEYMQRAPKLLRRCVKATHAQRAPWMCSDGACAEVGVVDPE